MINNFVTNLCIYYIAENALYLFNRIDVYCGSQLQSRAKAKESYLHQRVKMESCLYQQDIFTGITKSVPHRDKLNMRLVCKCFRQLMSAQLQILLTPIRLLTLYKMKPLEFVEKIDLKIKIVQVDTVNDIKGFISFINNPRYQFFFKSHRNHYAL